jgi:hypothetical protein
MLEGEPKKQVFASHGDFRRYLYEAPVMSIPVSWVESEQGTIKLFSSFELQIGLLDYGFHRKKS